jgi:predicted TIM-barrel fold metal-dependent hydrolase
MAQTESAKIRSRLSHPIVDSDGHWMEYEPAIGEYMERLVGKNGAQRYLNAFRGLNAWRGLDEKLQREAKLPDGGWWGFPTDTYTRMTTMLPKLFYQRLDDIGLDFVVAYPSGGALTSIPYLTDSELRRAMYRAFNMCAADLFRDYADRITPIGVVPTHTPQEAIEELEFVSSLGLKGVMMTGPVARPVPFSRRAEVLKGLNRDAMDGRAMVGDVWWDFLAMDSIFDYDPVWAKCLELKIVPTFHSLGYGGFRTSCNFVYNHIGHFAEACSAMCKAFFLGGVTRRFPKLKIAFLEGGAVWLCNLYSDLIRHWKVRNLRALELCNPARFDPEEAAGLVHRYGNASIQEIVKKWPMRREDLGNSGPEQKDQFARCGIERAEDIRDLFVHNFYAGCEAEDPMTAVAFNTKMNPYGAKINVLLSSDVGHFDVADITTVLAEAYELVENEILDGEQFRDFTFANPVRFWASLNPDFFKGTRVENEAARVLAEL